MNCASKRISRRSIIAGSIAIERRTRRVQGAAGIWVNEPAGNNRCKQE
jgi:hypothetical protein